MWWKVGAIAMGMIVVIWVIRYVMTPPPGTKTADQGREHVSQEQISKFSYNSNPPTSGPHEADWIRSGIYKEPQNEGKLIHSLEHGYVVVHYASSAAQLVPQLEEIARRKALKKLIVVSRPQLNTGIALTAWTYLDVFDDFDEKRIERFIDYHRYHGPEKTME